MSAAASEQSRREQSCPPEWELLSYLANSGHPPPPSPWPLDRRAQRIPADESFSTELSHSLLLTAGLKGNQYQHFSKMPTECPHVFQFKTFCEKASTNWWGLACEFKPICHPPFENRLKSRAAEGMKTSLISEARWESPSGLPETFGSWEGCQ